jgi:hypothetical protein
VLFHAAVKLFYSEDGTEVSASENEIPREVSGPMRYEIGEGEGGEENYVMKSFVILSNVFGQLNKHNYNAFFFIPGEITGFF